MLSENDMFLAVILWCLVASLATYIYIKITEHDDDDDDLTPA